MIKLLIKKVALLIPAIRSLYEHRNSLLAEKQVLTVESQAQRAQLAQLAESGRMLNQRVESLTSQIELLRSEREQLVASIEGLQAGIADLHGVNRLLHEQAQGLASQIAALDSERQQLTAASQAQQSTIVQLTQEGVLLRQKTEVLTADMDSLRSDNERLIAERDAQQSQIVQLTQDGDLLRKQLEPLQQGLEASRIENQALQAENQALAAKIQALQSDAQAMQDQNRSMRENVEQARIQNESLHALVQDYARETERFKSKAMEMQAAIAAGSENVPPYLLYRQRSIEEIKKRSRNGKAYAVICSMGRTATAWLNDALNLHPEIFFSHGPDIEPTKGRKRAEEAKSGTARIFRQMKTFNPLDIDGYFDLLESQGDYVVYGNIHGLAFTDRPESPARHRRPYYACAIVRHPIVRLQSFVNKWNTYLSPGDPRGAFLDLEGFRESEAAEALARTYCLSQLDKKAILFAKALQTIMFYDKHYFQLGIPLFQMERLVSDREYFLGLFNDVTAGLVEPTRKYQTALRKLKPFDVLRDESLSARSLFLSWDTWKQRYFSDELQKAEMLGPYDILGYNLRPILS